MGKKCKVQRVIFDLDGTLFNTQCFHAQVESALLAEHGKDVTPEAITKKYAGVPSESIFCEHLNCGLPKAKELVERKWEKLYMMGPQAEPLCDIAELFTKLTEKGIAISIGTASPANWPKFLLALNKVAQHINFSDIVGGDMVQRGKPSPDIWNMAAKRTPPQACLVVEDGIAGTIAAAAANMHCALIRPRKHHYASQIDSAMDVLSLV